MVVSLAHVVELDGSVVVHGSLGWVTIVTVVATIVVIVGVVVGEGCAGGTDYELVFFHDLEQGNKKLSQ